MTEELLREIQHVRLIALDIDGTLMDADKRFP